jgi:hypothetical protein
VAGSGSATFLAPEGNYRGGGAIQEAGAFLFLFAFSFVVVVLVGTSPRSSAI